MEDVEEIREQFPITKSKVFLNHAAWSPLPRAASESIRKYVHDLSLNGPNMEEKDDGGKALFSKLICAKPGEIGFVESTSMGMNIAANVLDYPRGSKIVTTDLEYPSVVYPWLRKRLGVKVHYVRNAAGTISLDDFERAVDDKTVAVAISHVEYSNGFRHNLKVLSEIVHEHGAFLIVDAIQSAGTMQLDVKRDDVDFLTAACYKWLLGPPGVGYLYVKDELIDKFEPPFIGWASVDRSVFETLDFWDIWNLKLSKTASRFEVGTPSRIGQVGAAESMKTILACGLENVQKRISKLTDHLMDRAKDSGIELQTVQEKQHRSGIVNIRLPNAQKACDRLSKKGIIVSARSRGLRVAPHYYNTEEEIDKLMNNVKHPD